ncbi:PAS and EAL domain-containing protein [Candidatus Bealeia paramacronuclearis]|uniref:PAS and EAL domain-containing protein n=1 Tax=Candidatus Bealeia paramacronuclearis TaxID=1921001 RepID=A0ABZ2C3M8_9PROT|nr:PAS and EAL domain-containing protein [Candidatus Bealeia paramacronuclearis]
MPSDWKIKGKLLFQIISILFIGAVFIVSVFAFVVPSYLLDELLLIGFSFSIFAGIILYVSQFLPLLQALKKNEKEAAIALQTQNELLAQQAKSLKAAYQHSLKKLKTQEERYALAVKGSNEGLWDWNVSDGTLYLSNFWKEILGYQKGEFPESFDNWKLSIHPEDVPFFENSLQECLEGESQRFECEYRMRTKNNSYKWVLTQGSSIKNKAGKVVRIVGSQTDISQKKKFEEQLYHDAFHDSLTGLPNRALFLDRLNQSILANQRKKESSYSVLFLDLDHFKSVNDTFGHAAGDILIFELARRIETSCRKSDTLARFGGDEFVLLLPELTKEADIIHFIETLQKVVREPVVFDNGAFHPSCTIGILNDTKNYTSAEDILRDADYALYKAKEKERGTFAFFDEKARLEAVSQFHMEASLQKALMRGEIFVFYEPIFSLNDKSLLGFEALLRWQHPEYGYVAPELFIPIAEENETIFALSEFLISQSLKQLKTWQEMFSLPHLMLSLNVSHRQIENERLYITLESSLSLYDLDPKTVIIDLTENAIFANRDKTNWYLKAMQKMGMRIAIDDFGAGYASLSTLNSYPFDIIKVDKSFLLDISKKGKPDLAMIDLIATLGHKMKKEVWIEGIEHEDLFEKVISLGCDYGQGHYLGRPQNHHDTATFLEAQVDYLGQVASHP